jgi:hypothetical protein
MSQQHNEWGTLFALGIAMEAQNAYHQTGGNKRKAREAAVLATVWALGYFVGFCCALGGVFGTVEGIWGDVLSIEHTFIALCVLSTGVFIMWGTYAWKRWWYRTNLAQPTMPPLPPGYQRPGQNQLSRWSRSDYDPDITQ